MDKMRELNQKKYSLKLFDFCVAIPEVFEITV